MAPPDQQQQQQPPRPPCEQLLSVAFSPVQADARPPRSTCPDRWTLSLTTGCPSPLPRCGTPPTEVRTSRRRQCPTGLPSSPLRSPPSSSSPSLHPPPSSDLFCFLFFCFLLLDVLHSWPAGGLPACLCLVTGHPPPSTPSPDPAPLLSHSGSRVHRGVYFNFTWWLPLKFFIFQVFSAFFFWFVSHQHHWDIFWMCSMGCCCFFSLSFCITAPSFPFLPPTYLT